MLSTKSDQEIRELLDEYGIKHGPVVGTTRPLYEKKLKEAMAKDVKPNKSSDKTFYREEHEEVTYVHYRSPLRNEGFSESRHYGSPLYDHSPDVNRSTEYSFQRLHSPYENVSSSKPTPLKVTPDPSSKVKAGQEKRFIPLWFQFMFFLIVAGILYFIFTSMETPQDNPFKTLE